MPVTIQSSEATPSDQPLPSFKGEKFLKITFWKQALEATSVCPEAQ